MRRDSTELLSETELKIYEIISGRDGVKAREIARELDLNKTEISRRMVSSALMRELCYQDSDYCWHSLVRQQAPYSGLYEFSGWYGTVAEFMSEKEETWLERLQEGCRRIGRNLNDTRGLLHSFRDCRETMRTLFTDLHEMSDYLLDQWEIVFELRLNMMRRIRIYADVLVITPGIVFSLEFKMKDNVNQEEIMQAAKYVPYLEILFGKKTNVCPALVLTGTSDFFGYEKIGESDYELPVCSGNMLFNVFNEYMGFLE